MKYFKLADSPQYDDTSVKADISALQTGKVDKVDGMSLIEDTEKERLSTITNDVATTTKNGLMSKEDKDKLDGLENYSLPIATADTLGGVKVGSGLSITDGILSATAGGSLKIDTLLPWKWYSSSNAKHTLSPASGVALSDYFGFVINGREDGTTSPAYSFFVLKECIEPAKEGDVCGGIFYAQGNNGFVIYFGKVYSNSTSIDCKLLGGTYVKIIGLRLK